MHDRFDDDAPFHAHIYFSDSERAMAEKLRQEFDRSIGAGNGASTIFVGSMAVGKAGPHPVPQFEVHFFKRALSRVTEMIRASSLRGLIHPLTDDDLADHTTLAQWIGEPLELDLTTLDPPGMNQGVPRFGKRDF